MNRNVISVIVLTSCLLLLALSTVFADSQIDSLENLLLTEKLTAKKELEIRLSIIHLLNFKGKRSDSLSLLSISDARKAGLPLLEAKASYARTRFLASKYISNNEYLKLSTFVDSVSVISPDDSKLYIYARIAKGKYFWLKRKYEEAAVEYELAIQRAELNQMVDEYFFLRTNLALNQGLAKQYFEAIKTSNQSLDDPGARAYFVHANLADLYGQLNDWENYAEHATLLLAEAEKINDDQAIFVGHIRKAEGLSKLGNKGESEGLLLALLARRHMLENRSSWYNSIYNALIDIYIENEQWEKGIAIADSLKLIALDKRYTYSTLAGKIGQCFLQKGEVNQAIKWCEDGKAVALAAGTRKFHYMPTVCQCLSDAYKIKGDLPKAFENLSLVQEFTDEEKENTKILDLSRALNQQELLKQKEILALEQGKKDAENQARNTKILYFGIGSILLAAVALLFLRQLKLRNNEVNKSNSLLEKTLGEKETLLQEIHHRVKNNLQVISSLLSLQSRYVEDESALNALNEGQTRVESMALIHQNLYREDNITGVNMKTYIPLLADNIFNSYNIQGEQVKIEYDIDELQLDVATVIPIGLVLNELISNALKYAFPEDRKGLIKVSLLDKNESLLLSIADNGIGIKNEEEKTGFGTKLIHSFTRKLEGELQISSDNGTTVDILIKNYKVA